MCPNSTLPLPARAQPRGSAQIGDKLPWRTWPQGTALSLHHLDVVPTGHRDDLGWQHQTPRSVLCACLLLNATLSLAPGAKQSFETTPPLRPLVEGVLCYWTLPPVPFPAPFHLCPLSLLTCLSGDKMDTHTHTRLPSAQCTQQSHFPLSEVATAGWSAHWA